MLFEGLEVDLIGVDPALGERFFPLGGSELFERDLHEGAALIVGNHFHFVYITHLHRTGKVMDKGVGKLRNMEESRLAAVKKQDGVARVDFDDRPLEDVADLGVAHRVASSKAF